MDEIVVVEDGLVKREEDKKIPEYEGAGRTELAGYVKKIFESFKSARLPYEEIWIECWHNFLGQYQPNLNWKRKTEGRKYRSKIFIKMTGLKCHTAHSKIVDVLFSGRNVMPFDIEALESESLGIPDNIIKAASDGLKKRLKEHFKKIWIKKTMDVAILEMAIFGTGILKGPIIRQWKTPQVRVRQIGGMPVNEIDSQIDPYEISYANEIVPDMDRVSIWNCYYDMNASSTEDSIGIIQFDRLLPAQFRQLAYEGGYDAEAVFEAARRAKTDDENDKKWIQLGDNYMGTQGEKDERVSVLEYWGLVPVKMLADAGCRIPLDVDEEDSVEALIVLAADGIVIKACVNPLGNRPFYVCPYKEKPGQIPGTGVAEMMRDSQKMINSSARMYVDNKALSGNGMVGINLDRVNTKRTKDLDVYSGKTWYIKGNFSPKEAVDSVTFPDITNGLREMMEMFVRFSDEETGIPKYTQGQSDGFLNKMLDINTPVPMLDGKYKKLEDIVDGDRIIGSDGNPTTVIKAHPIDYPKRAYEIKFRSGDVILAGGEHLWTVQTAKMSTLGIFKTIDTDTLFDWFDKYKTRIFIPRIQRPKFCSVKDLPLDPYILGLWLGNGHSYSCRITIRDEDVEVVDYIKRWAREMGGDVCIDKNQNSGQATTYCVVSKECKRGENGQFLSDNSLHSILKRLGLIKRYENDECNKYIPDAYFLASYEDRLTLLRGLMDTDGCHHSGNLTIFTQKEGKLLDDTIKLIAGLGGFPTLHETYPGDLAKEGIRYFNIHFSIIDNPFRFSKRGKEWAAPRYENKHQSIVSIREIDICPMRCLTVDAEDGLYAVGNRFTLTHNTATGMSMLMTQANINLKTVIENIDDYWIEPIVEAFGNWFIWFEGMNRFPFKFKATGADSLVAKEIKMENYMKFMQITSNPQDAIFMDRVKLMKNIARILETDEIMRSDKEIEGIMAEMTRQATGQKDWREIVDIDRLYPLLVRSEQVQILAMLGIKPDMGVPAITDAGMKPATTMQIGGGM